MRQPVKELFINGVNIRFQESFANPRGGDVVLFTMGNSPYKVGERLPFEGYIVEVDNLILPNEIEGLENDIYVKIVFNDSSMFKGPARCINMKKREFSSVALYSDVMIVVDREE